MVTSVIQSNYLPWRGYFDIIGMSDIFVFYDDVQYTKNDWRNRNIVKTNNGNLWLTVPCGDNIKRLIYEVKILNNNWQKKHYQSIIQNYARAKHFDYLKNFLKYVYLEKQWTHLSELNQYLIEKISTDYLGFNCKFYRSNDFSINGDKNERLVELLFKVGATEYISGPSAKDYIDFNKFEQAGIKIKWMNYSGYKEYPQQFPPFDPNVSILDLLLNCGPDSKKYLKCYEG